MVNSGLPRCGIRSQSHRPHAVVSRPCERRPPRESWLGADDVVAVDRMSVLDDIAGVVDHVDLHRATVEGRCHISDAWLLTKGKVVTIEYSVRPSRQALAYR